MRRNDPITNIMSKNPISVQVGQPLSAVRSTLAEHGFHHVPILNGTKLVGVMSSTDLVRLSFGIGLAEAKSIDVVLDYTYKLADVVTDKVATIGDGGTVREAAEVLSHGTFHSVPVVNNNNELVGMVTTTDLIRYLLEQY